MVLQIAEMPFVLDKPLSQSGEKANELPSAIGIIDNLASKINHNILAHNILGEQEHFFHRDFLSRESLVQRQWFVGVSEPSHRGLSRDSHFHVGTARKEVQS